MSFFRCCELFSFAVNYDCSWDNQEYDGGLPRLYDKQAIDKFWSARPVTVAMRSVEMAYELGPRILAGLWEFGIVPLMLAAPQDDDDSNSSSIQQRQYEEQLRRHAQKMCDTLTNLGPAYVKVGQQLSIRPDILPPVVLKELQKLCDAVRPITDDVAMQVLKQEWQVDDLSGIFQGDLQRVASASLVSDVRGGALVVISRLRAYTMSRISSCHFRVKSTRPSCVKQARKLP